MSYMNRHVVANTVSETPSDCGPNLASPCKRLALLSDLSIKPGPTGSQYRSICSDCARSGATCAKCIVSACLTLRKNR